MVIICEACNLDELGYELPCVGARTTSSLTHHSTMQHVLQHKQNRGVDSDHVYYGSGHFIHSHDRNQLHYDLYDCHGDKFNN